MPTTNFRLLDGMDAKAYQQLRLEALMVNPGNFLSVHAVEAKRSVLAYQYDLENAQTGDVCGYHGAFLDDDLVGYVQLGCSYLPKQAHVGFIYNLYISQHHRRLGLARQLFGHVIDQVRSQTVMEKLFVTCNSSNQEATHFYQALGFQIWGRKPGSVKWEGIYDDEVEWVLDLPPENQS